MNDVFGRTGNPERVDASRLLLADLLDWHEREAKPEWWQYFERKSKLEVADFIEDSDCIGGLTRVGLNEVNGKTVVVYEFPREQEYKLRDGDDKLVCPTRLCSDAHGALPVYKKGNRKGLPKEMLSGIGIVWIDGDKGRLALNLDPTSADPTVLMPDHPILVDQIQEALQRIAMVALSDVEGDSSPEFSAAFSLLEGRSPSFRNGVELDRLEGESAGDSFVRVAPYLDRSCLAVQGPPGSGKTYSLARAALACVANGMKVGICASKHSTLSEVGEAIFNALADSGGEWSRLLQSKGVNLRVQKQLKGGEKASSNVATVWPEKIQQFVSNLESESCQISMATQFWFARQELDEKFDIVFIDEAGQLSLANALGAATSGKSLVIVGDPQQLPQPSKGTHPALPEPYERIFRHGSAASALEHVIGAGQTLPSDKGILLDRTRRLRPEICSFLSESMYDGLLESVPECSNRWVHDANGQPVVGLYWLPTEHEGNKTSSDEEVATIVEIVNRLKSFTITDEKGGRAIGSSDIMVVAPYNVQVNALTSRLPGVAVGTVDKFQGKESGVVIVSMTASSAEDVPRGMEFLYSPNRLNVAISRAQALCIVVGSPTLLSVRCNSVEQMMLANIFCRLSEYAERWNLQA
jgi:hypothetical protein